MYQNFSEISFKKGGRHRPLYQQLESEIIQLICRGTLKPGQLLPSSRELAQILKLSRKTVVATYEELNAQGWVETRDRSGVYVSGYLPDSLYRTIKKDSEKLIRNRQPGYSLVIKQAPDEPSATNPNIDNDAPGTTAPRYRIDDGFPDPRIAPIEQIIREFRRFSKGHLTNRLLM